METSKIVDEEVQLVKIRYEEDRPPRLNQDVILIIVLCQGW